MIGHWIAHGTPMSVLCTKNRNLFEQMICSHPDMRFIAWTSQ